MNYEPLANMINTFLQDLIENLEEMVLHGQLYCIIIIIIHPFKVKYPIHFNIFNHALVCYPSRKG